jgi:lysophospholipase L1-like esterase
MHNMKKITSALGYLLNLLVTVTLILALLEGGLRLGGYVPRWGSFRASFASEVYKPVRNAKGEEFRQTDPRFLSVFQDQSFPVHKGGAMRVFAIGGSSTFGWGMDKSLDDSYVKVFERDFRKRYPTRPIEAINAGGIGYGSFRETALAHEITAYVPVLLLIYAGHNEFWEYPIYVKHVKKATWRDDASGRLENSRLFNFLRDMMVKANQKTFRVPTLFNGSYEEFDDAKYRWVLKRFEANLRDILQVARQRHVPVIVSTLGANLQVDPDVKSDWLWDASHHLSPLSPAALGQWQAAYDEGLAARRAGDCERAVGALSRAVAIDPTYARTYHELGACQEQLGQFDAAYETYWKHIDWSRRLVVRDLNQTIIRVCEQEGVAWVDGQAALEAQAPHRITGYGLFVDSMHPNREGHRVIGDLFFDKYEQIAGKH